MLIVNQNPKPELCSSSIPPFHHHVFTHGPCGSVGQQMDIFSFSSSFTPTAGLFLLCTENTNFQTGLTFQATPVTPISSCSFSFYFLEHFCPENRPLLSGELSTDSRQSSDSYFSSVQSNPGPDIKLVQIWLTNKSQPWAGYKTCSLLLFEDNRQYSQYSQSSRTILQTRKVGRPPASQFSSTCVELVVFGHLEGPSGPLDSCMESCIVRDNSC